MFATLSWSLEINCCREEEVQRSYNIAISQYDNIYNTARLLTILQHYNARMLVLRARGFRNHGRRWVRLPFLWGLQSWGSKPYGSLQLRLDFRVWAWGILRLLTSMLSAVPPLIGSPTQGSLNSNNHEAHAAKPAKAKRPRNPETLKSNLLIVRTAVASKYNSSGLDPRHWDM